MPRIRILHLINNLRMGGAQRYLVDCVNHMNSARFETEIVTVGSGNDFSAELPMAIRELGADLSTRNPLLLLPFGQMLRNHPPDILHTHLRYADTIGQWMGSLMGIPVITTIHGIVEWPRHQHTLRTWFEDSALHRANKIIAVSEAVRNHMISERGANPRRVTVLPCGVDLAQFVDASRRKKALRADQAISDDTVVFACTAQFRREKRHDLLLRDFAALCQRTPRNLFLRLIGEGGALYNEISEMILLQGLQNRVSICVGSRTDIAGWLGASDIYTMYSESEGTSMAVAEAMAAGLPALLPRRNYFADQVRNRDEGAFFQFDSTEDFCATALQLVADTDRRNRMGSAAQHRTVALYDIRNHCAQLEEIYSSMCHHRGEHR